MQILLSVTAVSNGFDWPDWLVLASYFLMLTGTGIWLSRRQQRDANDYFLAGRTMPPWAVAISVLATAQTAATFIGAPQSSYLGNLVYLSANIGQLLAALVVAFVFIPALYRCGATTVYELLETRVGGPARTAASMMFMVGRVGASGARLYMGALAGAMIIFADTQSWQVYIAITVLSGVGIGYTFVGGIRSVIWTDVIQAVVYVSAAVVALGVLWMRIPANTEQILHALREGMPDGASKLQVLQTQFGSIGPDDQYTLWTALIGFTLLNLGFYGTDQDAMQRMLTCRSAARGAWSMIAAVLVGLPVTLLFMLVGLLLWVFYNRPDLMGDAAPLDPTTDSVKAFLRFTLHEMSPGLSGLMMAGLFAAGLSSLNSALNALASSFVNDLYRRWRPSCSKRHLLRAGRAAVLTSGAAVGAFAMFCQFWQQHAQIPLIDFALLVMTFAYAGLVAVFLTVLFTNRGNNVTVIVALTGGFLLVVLMQPFVWETDCYLLMGAAVGVGNDWLAECFGQAATLRIAFPWQLTFATAIASIICCLGRRPPPPIVTKGHHADTICP